MAKCLLCNSSKQNEVAYGELLKKDQIVVHEFCLYLSSGLVQNGEEGDGLFGFLPKDIMKESMRVRKLVCTYCHENYANVGCCMKKCHRTFHMICGLNKGAENQFTETFRSYCDKHVRKTIKSKPPIGESCCICFDQLCQVKVRSYYADFIKAPCCQNGWFHKNCLQGFARSAGYFFKCPLCNDTNTFRARVPYLGIYVRNADASWELEPNAFAELMQRPSKCEAETCRNRRGRECVDSERNPILCCEICGARGSHKLCLPEDMQNFICFECIQSPTARTSLSEGDSGRESLHAVEDEDDEVDVCNISDSDDDVIVSARHRRNYNRLLTDNDTDDEPNGNSSNKKFYSDESDNQSNFLHDDLKQVINVEKFEEKDTKRKKQYFLYNSTDDEESSVELVSYNAHDENQPSSITKLNQKRKIVDLSDNKSDRSSPINKITIEDSSFDDDADPLDCLDKLFGKKRKIEDEKKTKKEVSSVSNESVSKSVLYSQALPSTKVSQTHQSNEEINGKSTQQHISKNKVQSDDFTNKENDCDFFESNVCFTNESDTKKNPFDISCIANRTRRRKTINSKNSSDKTPELQVEEKNKQHIASMKRAYSSDSSFSSLCSTNGNEEKAVSPLDISCIAKRTRRSKSIYYPQKNLDTIGEEAFSESSESYQTPRNVTKSVRDRLNGPSHSKDDGFSSDSQSSFSTIYSMSENSLNHVRKQRLHLISITSDEDLDENDAMKNR